MRLWPPLFIPPLAFLALLSAEYAMVPWACENQHRFPLHVASILTLALVLAFLRVAWRNWKATGVEPPDDDAEPQMRARFLAVLALMLSGLVCVATLAMWLTQFVLSPCLR